MTEITRTVKRRSKGTVFSRGHRRIIVSIEPNDTIGFRLERTRRSYNLPIAELYMLAVRMTVDAEARRFKARVRELIQGGYGVREAKIRARQEGKES